MPSRLIREQVEARITDTTIEIFHKGSRVASHVRSSVHHRHTTVREHMPSAHRRYAEWTPARMMYEARKIGPATVALMEAIMKAKPHPEQGFRACLGILRLARSYGPARVEAAAIRHRAGLERRDLNADSGRATESVKSGASPSVGHSSGTTPTTASTCSNVRRSASFCSIVVIDYVASPEWSASQGRPVNGCLQPVRQRSAGLFLRTGPNS